MPRRSTKGKKGAARGKRAPSRGRGAGARLRGGLQQIASTLRRRNVKQGFVDKFGVFHPIRAAVDYNDFRGGDFDKRSRKKPVEELSLSEFVRRNQGIKPDRDGDNAGEVRRLSKKESGTTGLVNQKRGRSAHDMTQLAIEAGYPVSSNSAKFLNLVAADAAGLKKTWHPERDLFIRPERYMNGRRTARIAPLLDIAEAREASKIYPKGARVMDEIGRKGTVKGQAGGYVTVLMDNYDRAHLIAPNVLTLLNPATDESVETIFEVFHGQGLSGEVFILNVPANVPDDVAVLGALVEIKLAGQDEILTFTDGQAWLGAYGQKGKRRLCIGLVQLVTMPGGAEPGKDYDYGDVEYVVYRTSKPHLYKSHKRGRQDEFIHYLGEEGGKRPRLILKDGLIMLRGGDYTIEDVGIKD
jgi:hypothetical protein